MTPRRAARKQERAKKPATWPRELVGGILEIQLQQLLEGRIGLEDLPSCSEIVSMKKNINKLVDDRDAEGDRLPRPRPSEEQRPSVEQSVQDLAADDPRSGHEAVD